MRLPSSSNPAVILLLVAGCGSHADRTSHAEEHALGSDEPPSEAIVEGEAPARPAAEEPSLERHERWETPSGDLAVVVMGDGPLGVVLLHGYGAPPEDLVPLGRDLAEATASTIVVPTSSRPWAPGGEGRAWFERTAPDGNEQIERARGEIDALLDRLRSDGHDQVVIAGFSQGASLAIEVALHARETDTPLAAAVVMSGRELPRYRGRWEALSGLPMLVSHGHADPVIPFASGERIASRAREAGAEISFVPFEGAHEMPEPVRRAVIAFFDGLARR